MELADAVIGAEHADPDADGQANLLEYAQGTDPRLTNEPRPIQIQTVTSQDGVLTKVSYCRLFLGHELDYRLESSADLRSWSVVTVEDAGAVLNEDGTVTVTQSIINMDQGGLRFFRIRILRK